MAAAGEQCVRLLGSSAIDAFTSEWNDRAAPFAWVKTADEILAKAVRKTKDHSDASH
jgi:hypothetical protein